MPNGMNFWVQNLMRKRVEYVYEKNGALKAAILFLTSFIHFYLSSVILWLFLQQYSHILVC